MLIDSVLRAGRFDQAKALLADRLQHRPRNAWGWRHYAQVLDRLGDGDGAATARDGGAADRGVNAISARKAASARQ
jgi:predicted Zn-dependent protease